MNKYQEALDKLDYCANQSNCWYCKFGVGCEGIQKIVSPLKELVDKATPKKVSNTELHHIDEIMKKTKCPQCSMYSYDFRYSKPKFCNNCGQALDWSEEDD